jgi:hypothetical protein
MMHMQQRDINYHIILCITTETPPVGQNQNTAIITSSVIAYITSSVLIFIIGCVCGWVGHKHRTKGLDKNISPQAAPVYEDIQPSASMPRDPRENSKVAFELKENVAYGPVPVLESGSFSQILGDEGTIYVQI